MGQNVFLTGEPGIGKSRLIEEFRSRIKDTYVWMECAGERFSESIPFHSVTRLLTQGLARIKDERAEGQMRQLESAIRFSGLDPTAMMPLIAEMLNLPPSPDYLPDRVSPDEARKRLLAGLAEWVLKLAKLQPLILAIEDLHWVDPSSIELIGMLVQRSADVPLMLLATARPEFQPPWELRQSDKSIILGRLSDGEIGEMIAGSSEIGLTEDVVARVVNASMGFQSSRKSCCRFYWKEMKIRRPMKFQRPCSFVDCALGSPRTGAESGAGRSRTWARI